jgi:hypothetical protein
MRAKQEKRAGDAALERDPTAAGAAYSSMLGDDARVASTALPELHGVEQAKNLSALLKTLPGKYALKQGALGVGARGAGAAIGYSIGGPVGGAVAGVRRFARGSALARNLAAEAPALEDAARAGGQTSGKIIAPVAATGAVLAPQADAQTPEKGLGIPGDGSTEKLPNIRPQDFPNGSLGPLVLGAATSFLGGKWGRLSKTPMIGEIGGSALGGAIGAGAAGMMIDPRNAGKDAAFGGLFGAMRAGLSQSTKMLPKAADPQMGVAYKSSVAVPGGRNPDPALFPPTRAPVADEVGEAVNAPRWRMQYTPQQAQINADIEAARTRGAPYTGPFVASPPLARAPRAAHALSAPIAPASPESNLRPGDAGYEDGAKFKMKYLKSLLDHLDAASDAPNRWKQ